MTEATVQYLPQNELEEFIQAVYKTYGYDFSDYSEASLKRRILRLMHRDNIDSLSDLKSKVIGNSVFLSRFIEEVTVNVTEMFRDPSFYRALREEVLPNFANLPVIRIWHAGCSTGEEVYSMAILLKESGLLNKTLLYATDINQSVLDAASKGIYSVHSLKEYSEAYIHAGGIHDLSDYCSIKDDGIRFSEELTNRMVFSPHNLVIDQSFNEFNLILCRNVLIYFNRNLQDKVLRLFKESIAPNGYLALGTKETIDFSSIATEFELIDKRNKIWKTRKLS